MELGIDLPPRPPPPQQPGMAALSLCGTGLHFPEALTRAPLPEVGGAAGARGGLWGSAAAAVVSHHGGFHLGLHVQFRLLLQRQQQRRPRRYPEPPPPGAVRRGEASLAL